jgi:hypothetical protein
MGYRCNSARKGQNVTGDNLESETLEDAIKCGLGILADRCIVAELRGIEIREGHRFLYPS